MAGPNGAVVRRAAGGPFVEEGFRRDRETVTTVRVANAQDGAGNGFALGDLERDRAIGSLDDGEQGDRAVPYCHLDG